MRRIFLRLVLICAGLMVWLAAPRSLQSRESMGTPAARKFYEQGERAMKKGDYLLAAKDYRKAIDLDANFVEAHSQYIFATKLGHRKDKDAAIKSLKELYEGWARDHPREAVYIWALGELCGDDHAKADEFYHKALTLDPSFARADLSLSLTAEFRGDNDEQRAYLKAAAAANPRDPQYLFYYSESLRMANPELYHQLTLEVVTRFPQSERAAQSLYRLAIDATTPEEKIPYLERLKAEFPPDRFDWSESGMEELFDAYVQTQPGKALTLAQEIAKTLPDRSDRSAFEAKVGFAQDIVKAEYLMAGGKYAEAQALLTATRVPQYTDTTRYELDRVEALDGAGDTAKAYDSLLERVAREPSVTFDAALGKMGAKLAKKPEQIEEDIWRKREDGAPLAKAFTLTNYADGKPLSLASLRGQIVLLDFWYPSCGPCRASFPYLEDVLEKNRSKKFVILAINVDPQEDKDVMPFLKGNHYGFIPLKSDDKWAAENYNVKSEPTSFLIDGQGRIIFKPHTYDLKTEKILDLEVAELLAHESGFNRMARPCGAHK